jgi:NAD-dependent SIR2 family protein deacetylase
MIPSPCQSKKLTAYLEAFGKIAILTGAGISTDSGIPDYRGPDGVYTRNKGYKPIQYQQFVQHHRFRQRYWARSYLGWPRISVAKPNMSHYILADYQKRHGTDTIHLITQNVDGLHKKAGTKAIEMHGTLHHVLVSPVPIQSIAMNINNGYKKQTHFFTPLLKIAVSWEISVVLPSTLTVM